MYSENVQSEKSHTLQVPFDSEETRKAADLVGESMRKVLNDKDLNNLGRKMSSAIESVSGLKLQVDAISETFKDNMPGPLLSAASDFGSFNYATPDLSSRAPVIRIPWQQLIVLGNGFDLQCGLHSKFEDFFRPRREIIASIVDSSRETWNRLVETTDLTLWDFILEASTEPQWHDVEATIEQWVLSACVSDPNSPFNVVDTFLKACPFDDSKATSLSEFREEQLADGSYSHDNISCYVWSTQPEIATEGYSHENFMDLLRSELFKLEHAFSEYLIHEVETNVEYANKCAELYHCIERDGKKAGDDFCTSTSVLSFNYTNFINNYHDGGENGVCVNIHGKLGEEIIFGIDGKDCMDDPNAVSFTKTFRLMQRGGSPTDKLISTANSANLQNATDVIKFYGHSLGKADYSYFQSIFDGVDLYESKTVLVFYYPYDGSDDAKEENERYLINLVNSINNLLVHYGATMENKDHGKNLMHKLLLEGRLILRGIQSD